MPPWRTCARNTNSAATTSSPPSTTWASPAPTPRGAFYVFADIRPTGLTSRDFSLKLLEEQKVAVVPGTAFGQDGEGFVRCSYATAMDQIKIAMERMAVFIEKLHRQAA